MYGWFLSSLGHSTEEGQKYLAKADTQDSAQQKRTHLDLADSISQPLSFFDTNNPILRISGDFETIGEIQKVNAAACQLLGYVSAELVGRNIALLIPSPFREKHDEYIRNYHETGINSCIGNNQGLILYFVDKSCHVFETRLLVKVVPNEARLPFLAAILRPTRPDYEVILLDNDSKITGFTRKCGEVLGLSISKTENQKINNYLPGFDDLQEQLTNESGVEYLYQGAKEEYRLKLKLKHLVIGSQSVAVLQIHGLNHSETPVLKLPREPVESAPVNSVSLSVPAQPQGGSSAEASPSDFSGEDTNKSELQESNASESMSEEASGTPASLSEPNSENLEESEEKSLASSEDASASNQQESEQPVDHSLKSANSEASKTKKSVLRFKLTLLLTILVLLITSVLTFEVIDSSISYSRELSHYVNMVGDLRLYSLSLSYNVRLISLMDTGVVDPTHKENYLTWMKEDIENMHEINQKVYRKFKTLDQNHQEVYVKRGIATWLLEGNTVTKCETHLYDATANLIIQGYLLSEEYQNSLDLTQRKAFYLYRNGHGETLEHLNASSSFYVNSALKDVESQRLFAIALIGASVILLLFCASFAIIPIIITLEKSRMELWELFFTFPPYVCRIMKHKCSERLSILNEQLTQELYGHREEEHNSDEGKEAMRVATRKNGVLKKNLLYDPTQRNLTILKLLSFFLISLVYFYLMYYTGFGAIGNLLSEEPIHTHWANRRRELSKSVNLWVLETLFENYTHVGYKYVVPSAQSVGSPYHRALRAIDELEYVENSLIFGNPGEDIEMTELRSEEHEALLFENACDLSFDRSNEDCEHINDKALSLGLHSALNAYTTLARTLLLQISTMHGDQDSITAFFSDENMVLLRDLADKYLYDPLKKSSELYEKDYSAHQDNMKGWQNLLISMYCVSSLIFVFFVCVPMINRIGEEIATGWGMCVLVPQEYQEDLKEFSAVLRKRRGQLNWSGH